MRIREYLKSIVDPAGAEREKNLQAEIERLCDRIGKLDQAHAALLFAFIDLVETGEAKRFPDEEPATSFADALASIKLLNEWRVLNKLNIRAVDVT
jgi:hypothetical protein